MSDSIEVSRQKGIYLGQNLTVRVRSRYGRVLWALNDAVLELTTPTALEVGLAMVRQGGEAEPGELVIVKINGKAIQFPASNAKQVGGALLRKADDADDFQLQRTVR